MKFEINLDMEELLDDEDFKDRVMREIGNCLCDYIEQRYDNYIDSQVKTEIKNIKPIQDKIEKEIVDNVTGIILRKREIKDLIPTKTEIQSATKENEKYISELIDKCIAKKFH